jgi:EAL domain-containing protein (putative c-di-GMP-specific phosphodiesterase class I)
MSMPRRGKRWKSIARTIIELVHSLNLQVIAEAGEPPEQLAFLRANGCDQVQGYLFSRPLPIKELKDFLRERQGFT